MFLKSFGSFVAVALMSLPLAALAQDDQAAHAEFCGKLEQVQVGVQHLQQMGPETTVGDFKATVQQIDKDLEAATKAGEKSPADQQAIKQLQGAQDDLRKSVANISDQMTVGEVRATISSKLQALRDAYDQAAASCK